jgi:BirA family biotin operon repressor/biotin-[acetyl-CoA-carboxylase] ligase
MKNNPDIIWIDKAESSNDEARKAIDTLDNLSVVAVRCQTRGRGQGTHTWETSPGENLTFSVVLKDLDILPNEQIAISQITALAIVELLARNGIEAQIKLPNDIYVADRKICGILIENSLCGNKIKWSIVGIGINVNQTIFPPSLPNPTSMLLEKNFTAQNLDLLLNQFHEIYSEHYSHYLSSRSEGKLNALAQLFNSKLLFSR